MPDLSIEKSCDGYVIGIDEAGRGPWAGPVTITALWLNPIAYNHLPDDINDSKKIKPHRRLSLADVLQMPPHISYTISKDVDDIDQHGVVKTTLIAMADAAAGVIEQMGKAGINGPIHALVDGPLLPKQMPLAQRSSEVQPLSIAGAQSSPNIAVI